MSKADFIRTPDGSQRIVDYNLEARNYFKIPVFETTATIGDNTDEDGAIAYSQTLGVLIYKGGIWENVAAAGYEPIITAGSITQLWSGDKTWKTVFDGGGKILASLLPSYVDDILEVSTYSALPTTGESGKIYITTDTNKTYRWSGSVYVEIVASPGTTDAITEGTTNLFYTDARVQTFADTRYYTKTASDARFSPIAGSSSIATVGVITAGTWQGIAIADAYISSASYWNSKQDALSGPGLVKSISGTISYITDNSGNWNTSFSWGNWASNFGSSSGTIAQGNDSRINNGQTAFGWGNHSGLYPTYSGTGATGTWGIGISGNSATVTTNANLTGPITSAGNATSIASKTGTGSTFVMDGSPTLITPILGVASAISVTTATSSPTSNTIYDGFISSNLTAATSANQQYSPALHFISQGWKTAATAGSQQYDTRIYDTPIQSGLGSHALIFDMQTAGGGYSNVLSLSPSSSYMIGKFTISTGTVGGQAFNIIKDGGVTTGSSGVNIFIQDTNTTNPGIAYIGVYDRDAYMQAVGATGIRLIENGGRGMKIFTGGRVGIGGSGTPAGSLTDNGVDYLQVFGTGYFSGVLKAGAPIRLKSYTVATLPSGTQNDLVAVTDALAPTYNTILVGGGTVYTMAVYDGTNWVAH